MRKFIDLETGSILLDDISLSKTTTVQQMQDYGADKGYSFKLLDDNPNIVISEIIWKATTHEEYSIALNSLFKPNLSSCFISIFNEDWPYLDNWEDYSAPRETEKIKFMEEWAKDFIGTLGDYPWGRIRIVMNDFARFRIDYF